MNNAEARALFEDFDYLHEGLYHPLAYALALLEGGQTQRGTDELNAVLRRLSTPPLADDHTAEIHYLRATALAAQRQHDAATAELKLAIKAGFRYQAWHHYHPVWRYVGRQPALTL
jgi:hypothetical protein